MVTIFSFEKSSYIFECLSRTTFVITCFQMCASLCQHMHVGPAVSSVLLSLAAEQQCTICTGQISHIMMLLSAYSSMSIVTDILCHAIDV